MAPGVRFDNKCLYLLIHITGPAGLFMVLFGTLSDQECFLHRSYFVKLPQWGLFPFWSLSHVCPSLHNSFTQRNITYLFLNVLPFQFPRIPSLPRNTNKAHKLECPSRPFCSRHWSKHGASLVTLHEQVWI